MGMRARQLLDAVPQIVDNLSNLLAVPSVANSVISQVGSTGTSVTTTTSAASSSSSSTNSTSSYGTGTSSSYPSSPPKPQLHPTEVANAVSAPASEEINTTDASITSIFTVTSGSSIATVTSVFPNPSASLQGSPQPMNFFENKGAVVATFTLVGIAVLAIFIVAITACLRRGRANQISKHEMGRNSHFMDDDDDDKVWGTPTPGGPAMLSSSAAPLTINGVNPSQLESGHGGYAAPSLPPLSLNISPSLTDTYPIPSSRSSSSHHGKAIGTALPSSPQTLRHSGEYSTRDSQCQARTRHLSDPALLDRPTANLQLLPPIYRPHSFASTHSTLTTPDVNRHHSFISDHSTSFLLGPPSPISPNDQVSFMDSPGILKPMRDSISIEYSTFALQQQQPVRSESRSTFGPGGGFPHRRSSGGSYPHQPLRPFSITSSSRLETSSPTSYRPETTISSYLSSRPPTSASTNPRSSSGRPPSFAFQPSSVGGTPSLASRPSLVPSLASQPEIDFFMTRAQASVPGNTVPPSVTISASSDADEDALTNETIATSIPEDNGTVIVDGSNSDKVEEEVLATTDTIATTMAAERSASVKSRGKKSMEEWRATQRDYTIWINAMAKRESADVQSLKDEEDYTPRLVGAMLKIVNE